MKTQAGKHESARLHYIYCDGCGEYKSHTITPQNVCRGNCGMLVHDDPKCPLVGAPLGEVHQHAGADCYDC